VDVLTLAFLCYACDDITGVSILININSCITILKYPQLILTSAMGENNCSTTFFHATSQDLNYACSLGSNLTPEYSMKTFLTQDRCHFFFLETQHHSCLALAILHLKSFMYVVNLLTRLSYL
jgi:hypothetical protein